MFSNDRRGFGAVGVDHLHPHAGLHGDEAEGVRDDVVQLLGDPQTLVGGDSQGCLALFPIEGIDALTSGLHRPADQHGERERR